MNPKTLVPGYDTAIGLAKVDEPAIALPLASNALNVNVNSPGVPALKTALSTLTTTLAMKIAKVASTFESMTSVAPEVPTGSVIVPAASGVPPAFAWPYATTLNETSAPTGACSEVEHFKVCPELLQPGAPVVVAMTVAGRD